MTKPVTTRRDFLQTGLTMLAAGASVPAFLSQTAYAVGRPAGALVQGPTGADGKVLVVIQLAGGNDGLSTVVPYADDAYHAARPGVGHRGDGVIRVTDYLGLHPNLAPLADLLQAGRMSVVQGVGYPNPNRSHFSSMDIWHTATADKGVKSGWLGRYFDAQCSGTDPKDPHVGVSLGETNRLAMQGEEVMPLSFERPQDYRYKGQDKDAFGKVNTPTGDGGHLDFLTRTAMDAQVSRGRVLDAIAKHNPSADYPRNGFGSDLKTVAAMIRGQLPTRVYYVSLGGFDTHANQRGAHDRLMDNLAKGVGAFLADLAEQGNDERVCVMTFSEFGRRVAENASGGTDHGAAAPMLFFGHEKHLNGGIHGRHPSLTDLDSGDLKYNLDFRTCYAGVLGGWLDTDPRTTADILGGRFDAAPVVRG